MGIFSSKTKYFVSSSTVPMYDRHKRVNNYEAGMLDYTATSPIERSEYFKNHYKYSRLPTFKAFPKWADDSGFSSTMGKIQASFYGDAKIDNTVVADAIKGMFTLDPTDTFGVYNTALTFFSEDFWIKHLATQQGKAKLVYPEDALEYTISNPTDTTIRATFKNGNIIEGPLPKFEAKTRFLEIKYNIIKEKVHLEPVPNPDPTQPAPPPKEVKYHEYNYGFYHYQEGTGNAKLDELIRNNGMSLTQSFFPVIPLRTNSHWFSGSQAEHINAALKRLKLYSSKKVSNAAYKDLQKTLTDGMKQGSMGDIDYITLLHGVPVDSRNNSDQKYIFHFFFNLYANQALAEGRAPESFVGGLPLTQKKGSLNRIHRSLFSALRSNRTDDVFKKFVLHNPHSNFNYTYGWLDADYFDMNGKWHPEAKVGDYGPLAGTYTITYTVKEYLYEMNDEGEYVGVYGWIDGKYQRLYRWVPTTSSYSITMFCWQFSENRWKALFFTDLKQVNLVYAGKVIHSDVFGAVKDSNTTSKVAHDFTGDYDGYYKTWDIVTFDYVKITGDEPSTFIVPLEKHTFDEVGARDALDITEGSQQLIFNCWVAKKVKWYQDGWLGIFKAVFITLIVAPLPILGPIAITLTTILITAKAIELAQKTLSIIVGDRWATKIVMWVFKIIRTVISVIASIAINIPVIGWLIWGICMTVIFIMDAAYILWQGGSLSYALKSAFISSSITGLSTMAGKFMSTPGADNAYSGAASLGDKFTIAAQQTAQNTSNILFQGALGFGIGTLTGLGQGMSFKNSLKMGLRQGAMGAATATFTQYVLPELKNLLPGSTSSTTATAATSGGITDAVANQKSLTFMDQVLNIGIQQLTNPMNIMEFAKMSIEEIYFHKMANLENDYQEFANKHAAANKVLNMMAEATCSTVTAETVCRMQATLGRSMSLFPESYHNTSPDSFMALATLSGSDVIKTVLGSVDTFIDNKMSLDGYEPASLHYSALSYTLTWDQDACVF